MSHDQSTSNTRTPESPSDEISLLEIFVTVRKNVKLLTLAPLISAAVAVAGSFAITPKFTASTQIMPPQQQQSSAAALLGSLAGGLSSATGLKNPSDQWVGLLKSRTIADGLITKFDLKTRYETEFMFEARKSLENNTKISAGKDSLIDIEVTDEDPQVAADIANAYVSELQNLSKHLAVSEAAQRRLFFERQLAEARDNLITAETALQESGVSANILKTSPEAALSGVAQLKAQITAAEVNLSVLRGSMTENSPQVRQAAIEISSLKSQLDGLEKSDKASGRGGDYIQKFRNFKYYETLFELLARQYELAKSDEAKEGAIIQVVDAAQIPEWKSSPKRAIFALSAFALGLFSCIVFLLIQPTLLNLRKSSQRLQNT